MTEQCVVKKVRKSTVYIEIKREEKCAACGVCAFNNKKTITVPASSDIRVECGQTVEVEMPVKSVGVVALLIYVFPLVLGVCGAALGLLGEVWLQIVLCAVGIAAGLAVARLTDCIIRRRTGVIPKIVGIVNSQTSDAYSVDSVTEKV